jgi:hypothetical protein
MARAQPEASEVEPVATARRFHRLALSEPTRFRIAGAVLVAGVLMLGVVGLRSATDRHDAATELSSAATPRLAAADDVYVRLTDADAAASTAFLRGTLEPLDLRRRYDSDMQSASSELSAISTNQEVSTQAKQALVVLDQQLPVYAGLVESARSNNRLGFPVGAAYLRSASLVMRNQILPAITTIYEDAAHQTSARYRDGTAGSEVAAVALVAGVVFVLLLATEIALAFATHRVLNIGLAVATVLVVVIGTWLLTAFAQERSALATAREKGSDALQMLSTERILTLRSFSDDNLELVERGAASDYLPDFDRVQSQLVGANGLFDETANGVVGGIRRGYQQFLGDHQGMRADEDNGQYSQAVTLVSGTEAHDLASLDRHYETAITAARTQIAAKTRAARNALTGAGIGSLVLAILAAVAIVVGLRRRIQEFA